MALTRAMSLLSELHHAARSLARAPGLVAVAVASLALGIGANATIFNFVNAIEFRPLPFPEADRLVDVHESNPAELCEGCAVGTSWPTFSAWRTSARTFAGLESYREASYALAGEQEPERVGGALVTAGLFPLLGVRPILGRGLVSSDDRPGAPGVVLIGHGLWVRRFGADSGVLGTAVRVNGTPRIVIGVMPPKFRFPEFATLWLPMAPEVQEMALDDRSLSIVGRLGPGVTLEASRLEMAGIARGLETRDSANYAGWTAGVSSLRADLTEDGSGQGFLLALAAAGFVLLIACANLANLFLARATARARELAVRVALGATRMRIAGHLLAESVLLGLAGGLAGLVLSLWGVRLIARLIGTDLPFWLVLGIDWRLVLFTSMLSLVAGVAFGLVPVLRMANSDVHEVLKSGAAGATPGRRDGRVRGALAIAQIALAIVLLAGAGLLVKSFLVVRRTDNLGYNPRGLLSAQIQLQAPRYEVPEQVGLMQEQLMERLRVQPMVEAAAIEHPEFLGAFVGNPSRITLEGRPEPVPISRGPRHGFAVSPDYFRLMEIPLDAGRGFTPADGPGAAAVAMINQSAAALLWPGSNAVGKRLRLDQGPWMTVIGVVGDIVVSPLGRGPEPLLYTAAAQSPARPFRLLLRYRGETATLATTLRAVARTVDADEPIEDVMTLEAGLAQWISPVRFMAWILATLGVVALLLSAVGIYGVMSYLVTRRTREIGIRMALGAEAANLRRYVLGYGFRLAAFGLALGLPAAFGLSRLLRSVLFSVNPADPLVFGAAALLLAAIAVGACWSPARRATRVDPLEALRAE
jgi:putative ABC transport system permease protein